MEVSKIETNYDLLSHNLRVEHTLAIMSAKEKLG